MFVNTVLCISLRDDFKLKIGTKKKKIKSFYQTKSWMELALLYILIYINKYISWIL